ncbi:MAG: heme-binding domain-containing protein [Pyrinomonadaceae bacterium]
MKRALKVIVLAVFGIFIGLQFIRPERTNPPIDQSKTIDAALGVPKNIEAIFKRSCDDCHSNKTVYPWYSNIAPISWSVVDHVRVGRSELNFSEWGTYSVKKQDHKLEEICDQIKFGEMPHNQYLWLHWDASLSEDYINSVCEWTKAERDKLKPE